MTEEFLSKICKILIIIDKYTVYTVYKLNGKNPSKY